MHELLANVVQAVELDPEMVSRAIDELHLEGMLILGCLLLVTLGLGGWLLYLYRRLQRVDHALTGLLRMQAGEPAPK